MAPWRAPALDFWCPPGTPLPEYLVPDFPEPSRSWAVRAALAHRAWRDDVTGPWAEYEGLSPQQALRTAIAARGWSAEPGGRWRSGAPGAFPTLGWHSVEWQESWLRQADGELEGQPLRLYAEQVLMHVRWHRLSTGGAFAYRRGLILRSQKWGKGPWIAGDCAYELLGAPRWGGWSADGEPVGKQWATPVVQLAALSLDQTDNVWPLTRQMIALSGDLLAATPALAVHDTFIELRGTADAGIWPVTAAAGSRMGQRVTAPRGDESHLWSDSNGGNRLGEILRGNSDGTGGRFLETTNAYAKGENSHAEQTHLAAQTDSGIMVDSRQPRDDLPDLKDPGQFDRIRREVIYVLGDSADVNGGHVDVDRYTAGLVKEPNESWQRRTKLSQIAGSEDRFMPPWTWLEAAWCPLSVRDVYAGPAVVDPAAPKPIGDNQRSRKRAVAVGFDGSIRQDVTGFVLTDMETGHQWAHRWWSRPATASSDWEIDQDEVDRAWRDLVEQYDVEWFYGDPWAGWRDVIARWSRRHRRPDRIRAFDTTQTVTTAAALDAWRQALNSRSCTHGALPWRQPGMTQDEVNEDRAAIFTDHVLNAFTDRRGQKDADGQKVRELIRKDRTGSVHKIDLAMCAALSWQAYLHAIQAGYRPSRQMTVFGNLKESSGVRATDIGALVLGAPF